MFCKATKKKKGKETKATDIAEKSLPNKTVLSVSMCMYVNTSVVSHTPYAFLGQRSVQVQSGTVTEEKFKKTTCIILTWFYFMLQMHIYIFKC